MRKTAAVTQKIKTERSANKQMTIGEWSLIGLLSIIWGSSFFFMKTAVAEIPPLTIMAARISIAAVFLLIVSAARGKKLPHTVKDWGAFLIMGLFSNVIPFSLIIWGLQYIDSSLGSLLNATTPIFSVILVFILTKDDQLTPNRIIGVITGWFGVAVLIGLGALLHMDGHIGGQFAVLGASCSYALSAIYGRRFRNFSPLTAAAAMLTCGSVVAVPVALIVEQPWTLIPGLSFTAIGAAVILGVVCTGTAYLIYYRVLATAGPTNVLLVTFLVPVTAVLLGIIVLGEVLTLNTIIGAILLFIGLILIDGRVLKKRAKE
ncbi:MAG: DMT family transporter [Bacteroidetes bacterium]|nr:DMT family transporter [Bacteroidota bacterium]